MPKVSVIIPCYNHGQYVDEAVESVLNQTFQDFEIIIVNDGSTDNTQELALAYAKRNNRITVIKQNNQGLSAARNNGIIASKGYYILPLDADDKIHKKYLAKSIAIYENIANVDIVYGNAELFGTKNETWSLREFSIPLMLKQNLIYCSAIFRKSIYLKTKGYNPNMKYGWEDWDLWLSMIEQGAKIRKIDETLFYYRVKEESMVKDIAKETIKRQYLEQQLISNHIDLYRKYFPEPLSMLRELDALGKEKEQFEKYKQQIYNSASYKIGSFLLKPIKWIKKLL